MKGLASPTFKHGRYSRSLPVGMGPRATEALSNPRLLSLSDDVAVSEARLAQLLEQAETGESGAGWQALKDALVTFRSALTRRDGVGMDAALTTMEQVVQRGGEQSRVWQEIQDVWGARCKLVQTEMKTLQSMQQMLTLQQHMLLVGAQTDVMVRLIEKYVDVPTGRKMLMELQAEFDRLAHIEERR